MIRASTADDSEAIIDVWLAASREAHDFIPFDFWLSQVSAMRDVYLPGSETYVFCDADGSVLGFLSLVGDDLAALFVAPSHQCHGVGGLLLRRAQSLRKRLDLRVYSKNIRATAFYRAHGFISASERVDERTAEPEICMAWSATA